MVDPEVVTTVNQNNEEDLRQEVIEPSALTAETADSNISGTSNLSFISKALTDTLKAVQESSKGNSSRSVLNRMNADKPCLNSQVTVLNG